MFEILDGRTTDYGRQTDPRVTGILLAHPLVFGSGELIIYKSVCGEGPGVIWLFWLSLLCQGSARMNKP